MTIDARGGTGNDLIKGGARVDFLFGGPGSDTLAGGRGDDVIDGGQGADPLRGGPGSDLADYSRRTNPVRLGFDGRADDGERGEADTLHADVEGAQAGAGDDLLVGNGKQNFLSGREETTRSVVTAP